MHTKIISISHYTHIASPCNMFQISATTLVLNASIIVLENTKTVD